MNSKETIELFNKEKNQFLYGIHYEKPHPNMYKFDGCFTDTLKGFI